MKKLTKSTLPSGHRFDDFKCFGPPATQDGIFEGTKIADFGCFNQDGSDNNKYYNACVCKSKLIDKWFCFVQWGRVGNSSFDFQFFDCDSEEDAQKAYEKQCHSKNDKRGEWYDHPLLGKILRAKPKKDCYLVRNMATRISALPDANKITTKSNQTCKTSKSSGFDRETETLLKDLSSGTVTYTRSKFSSGMIPDISAIAEGRKILSLAVKAKPKELTELTKILYSKIPKSTCIGEKVELSSANIKEWYDDLDAFESAYNNVEDDPGFSIKYLLKYVDKSNQEFHNIVRLVESSTRNRHAYLQNRNIKILHIWEITNIPDSFIKEQERVAKEFTGQHFPLIFQPKRTDLEQRSNCQLLFHGSRTVNIIKILMDKFKTPRELSGVSINGAINGPAIYHGLDWRKSAGYCSIQNGYWSRGSGSINNREAFMFINDVILGNPYIITKPRPSDSPPNGYHSVIANTEDSFQNEECMIYSKELVYPRYLMEFII